ncbi:hypothetical protein EXS62_02660 [Candidatus Kaiserbacteria bacterium]|nr:hypothetical protein [Candidatus Kaiserbacteria bacterium]
MKKKIRAGWRGLFEMLLVELSRSLVELFWTERPFAGQLPLGLKHELHLVDGHFLERAADTPFGPGPMGLDTHVHSPVENL